MTTKFGKILVPSPWGSGNHHLWGLKYEVEDDRFIQIMTDIAKLIKSSERRCAEVEEEDEDGYRQFVVESECDYLEELIGASFLVLQTKIRRVTTSALSLSEAMLEIHGIKMERFGSSEEVWNPAGYGPPRPLFIEKVWHVGNYYKHRDEWDAEVWEEKCRSRKQRKSMKQAVRTCKAVQEMGLVQFSTGNMRRAHEFFGIEPYSNCVRIAEQIQDWASEVYQLARSELEAKANSPGR